MDWTGMEAAPDKSGPWPMLMVRVGVTALAILVTLLLISGLSGSANASDEGGPGGVPTVAAQEADDEAGLVIVAVDPAGPAAAAGLRRGDILLTVDGAAVDAYEQLWEAITSHASGDAVSLGVLHGDEQRTLNVTLGERDGRAYLGATPWPAHPKVGCDVMPLPALGGAVTKTFGITIEEGEAISGTLRDVKEGLIEIGEPLSGTLKHCAIGGAAFGAPDVTFMSPDNLPEGASGIMVHGIVEGGPAASAGIEAGTLITALEGAPIESPDDIENALSARQPGDTLKLTVIRPGQQDEEVVEVTLGEDTDPEDSGKASLGIKEFHVFIHKELAPGELPEKLRALQEKFACPEEAEQEFGADTICLQVNDEDGAASGGMMLKGLPGFERGPALPRSFERLGPMDGSI